MGNFPILFANRLFCVKICKARGCHAKWSDGRDLTGRQDFRAVLAWAWVLVAM